MRGGECGFVVGDMVGCEGCVWGWGCDCDELVVVMVVVLMFLWVVLLVL